MMRRSSRPWRSGRRRCVDGIGPLVLLVGRPAYFRLRCHGHLDGEELVALDIRLRSQALHLGQPVQQVLARKQSCRHSARRSAWLPRPPLSRPSFPTAAYIPLCKPPLQLFDERPFLEELLEYLYSVEVRHCPQQLIEHPMTCQPARAGLLYDSWSAMGVSSS